MRWSKSREGGSGEAGIFRNVIFTPHNPVREVAPSSPGNEYLACRLFAMIEDEDRPPPFPRLNCAHQARCAGSYYDHVSFHSATQVQVYLRKAMSTLLHK